MKIKPWSHLSNATQIEWVIDSAKRNPAVWKDGFFLSREGVQIEARTRAWDDAWQSSVFTWADADAAVSLYGARAAIFAFITYSDCHEYLSMTHEQLHAWAILSESPQAILLLPMKWVQENERMVASA